MSTPEQPNQYQQLNPSSSESLPQGVSALKQPTLAEMISVTNDLLGKSTQEAAGDLSEIDELKDQSDAKLIEAYRKKISTLSDVEKETLLKSLIVQREYELKALAASSVIRPANATRAEKMHLGLKSLYQRKKLIS